MYMKVTYEQDFDDLMMHLRSKYGNEMMNMDGIGEQTDMSKFSRKFFSSNVTSDASIDANANVDDISVIAYNTELPKPFFRLNSYYILWDMLVKLYGLAVANDIIERQLSGDIYINDFHGIAAGQPYSYFGQTSLILKDNNNGGKIILTTMKELFYDYQDFIEIFPDRETINLKEKNLSILEKGKWVKLERVLRHSTDQKMIKFETKSGSTTIVTANHPVILEDGSEKEAKDISINDKIMENDINLNYQECKVVDIDYAYMIGFIIGDGWLNITPGKTTNVRRANIEISQKNIQNTKIFNIVNKLFDNVTVLSNNKICFGYKADVEKLLDIGIGSENKKLPKDILNWNKNAIIALLCGLVDADGSVNKTTGMVDIRVSSFALVQQVADILRSLKCGKVRTSLIGKYQSKNSFNSNFDIFRVSIRLNEDERFLESEKIDSNKEKVFKRVQKDGRFETNEVLKVEEFMPHGELKYVYDVTTESGCFYSQGMIQHNCFNYSTYDILTKGLPMVKKIKSDPPKYLYAFKSQLEQFTVIASNSTLGAAGLADLLIVMSYYMKNILRTKSDAHFHFATEEDCWLYARENLVSFIYTINQPMRANQSPFTNVSIYDINFLNTMCEDYIFPDGSAPDIAIVQKLQEIYLDVMNSILRRTPCTFPVTTACFSVDKDSREILDKDFVKFIARKNQDFGFINIYCGDSATLSSCCRLRSDTKNEYFNSFGSGSSKIGSLGVCTINLPRIAIKARGNIGEYERELIRLIEVCSQVNHAKRMIVKKRVDNGNLPLYTLGFMELGKQYSTTGINGLNEAVEIMGENILTKEGQAFVLHTLNIINTENDKYQKLYQAPHNCEQIPAENVSIKMAMKDRLLGYQDEYDIYSNQFIPLTTNADLLDRIKLQGMFDKHFSGGAICHLNVDTKIEEVTQIEELIEICAVMGVIYFAINYNLQECEHGHMTVGKGEICSICGGRIENNYTRVVGFLTNTKNWHKIRREEDYPNRKWYKGNEI